MYTLLQRIHDRGRLPRRPPPPADVLAAFSIQDEGTTVAPEEFIQRETEKYAPEEANKDPLQESIEKGVEKVKRETPILHPVDRRPRQQMGLEQFMSPDPTPTPKEKEQSIHSVEPQASTSEPILDGLAHRKMEQLAAAAASASITELQGDAEQTAITLDHRESKSTLAPYIKSMGAMVTFKHLTTGDVRLSNRVLIERKTARDLVQSLTDGRLLHQCRRLNAAALRPLLLIEIGEGHGQAVHPDAVHGALAYISLDLGIPVMMTKNAEETARFLVAAARREHDLMEHWAYRAMQRVAPHQDVAAV